MKTYTVNEVFYSLQGEGIRAGTANIFIRLTGCNLQCSEEPGPKSPGGFDCDTEFESGKKMSLDELHQWVSAEVKRSPYKPFYHNYGHWIILTGGEPALQVDEEFCKYWHDHDYSLAIETNGSKRLCGKQDWWDLKDLEKDDDYSEAFDNWWTKNNIEDILPSHLDKDTDSEEIEEWFDTFEGKRALYPFDWITVSPKVAEHAIRQTIADEVKYVRGYGQAIPKTRVLAPNKLISPAFDGLHVNQEVTQHCVDLVKENPAWRLSPQMHKLWKAR